MVWEVEVREAVMGYVAGVVGLSSILFLEDAGRRDPFVNLGWPQEEGFGYFADVLACERSLLLVAEAAGGVVGYLAGRLGEGSSLRPVKVAVLESTCVRPEHRSRGVGTRLVEEFFSWARSREVRRAEVTTYAANGRAILFYRRFGFRPKSLSLEAGVG